MRCLPYIISLSPNNFGKSIRQVLPAIYKGKRWNFTELKGHHSMTRAVESHCGLRERPPQGLCSVQPARSYWQPGFNPLFSFKEKLKKILETVSHSEGKAYNISFFAFSQRKRIGCDQSLNQLRSSGLGYRAEDKWGLRSKNPFYPEMQSKWYTGVMFSSWSDTDRTQQSRLGFWFSSPWPISRPMNYFVMFYQHCQGLSQGVGQEKESYLSSQQPGASDY